MAKVNVSIWAEFELSVEVNEGPTVVGTLLTRVLEKAGYTAEEMATVARTLFWNTDSIDKGN
jgi:hypothetical protein